MFAHEDEPIFMFTDGMERPIEKDVLKGAHKSDRIIEFSDRAIFNSEHAAILIRKMPDDVEKRGRLRDHLALLIDAIVEKLQQFINDKNKRTYYQTLDSTIDSVTRRLQQVILSYQKQRLLNSNIMGDLLQNIEASFLKLGLESSQEELLISYLTDAEQETENIYKNDQHTSDTFDEIISDLVKLLEHQS